MNKIEMQTLLPEDSDDHEDSRSDAQQIQQNSGTWPKQGKNKRRFGAENLTQSVSFASKKLEYLQSPLFSLFPTNNTSKSDYEQIRSSPNEGRGRSRSEELSSNNQNTSELFRDINANNHVETILSTIDRFEDELDQQAYVELIPLNIRMALENQIIGWDHLYSTALGHVLLPIMSFAFTWSLVSIIGLNGVGCRYGDRVNNHEFRNGGKEIPQEMIITSRWICNLHKAYQFKAYAKNYVPIFGMNFQTLHVIRLLLALWSALSTFRSIRRRRRVWLHHQTNEYFRNNSVAQMDIQQADRETILGKIRWTKDKWLEKRINRRIHSAAKRYAKREERRSKHRDEKTNKKNGKKRNGTRRRKRERYEDKSRNQDHQLHERSSISTPSHCNTSIHTKASASIAPCDHNSTFSPLSYEHDYDGGFRGDYKDENKRTRDELQEGLLPQPDPDGFLDTYENYKRSGKEEYERHMAGNSSTTASQFYGHTMPAFAMQSIAQDQIRFKNGPIQNIAYAHGGFFGAAPFMLANPHWINILRTLMPDVYVELSRRVVKAPVPQLIHWAENNPIVAAYGTAHELEYFGKVPTIEWDVFLDPHLVQRVEVVLEARDEFLKGLAQKSPRIERFLKSRSKERRYTDKMDGIITYLRNNDDEKKILHFYNTEIEKRVLLLLEHMLIAHGNASQLALEQTGYLKQYNFSRVKHTRRTLGGGIFAKHWIMMYTEALKMSTEFDEDILSDDDVSTSDNSDISPASSDTSSVQSSPSKSSERKESEYFDLSFVPSTNENDGLLDNSKPPSRDNFCYKTPFSDDRNKSQSPRSPPRNKFKPSTSFHDLSMSAISSSSITECMTTLKKIMVCDAPLGLVLDIKSRHVPKRVWALVLDALRYMGARVEGIGTFAAQDIRDISKYCAAPLKEMVFFHCAGDLQHACHSGFIRRGDSVFFNAGSLFWNYPAREDHFKVISNVMCWRFDAEKVKDKYKFQPYARVQSTGQTEDDDCIRYFEGRSSTIQQYKEQFEFSIGLYVQEFAIDERSMDLLVKYVNMYPHIYNLGLSWGGVNGVTVRGIQPGRFTNTDGLWNQRYIGERWDADLYPGGIH